MQPSHSIVDLRSGFMTNTDTGPTSKQNKYGQPFNAQLHRGAIIYVIKASGLNVLLLRATTAYRYVGCRGIVSPPPEFLHASCCTALLGLLCMTARRIPLACAVVGRRSIQASAFAVYAF